MSRSAASPTAGTLVNRGVLTVLVQELSAATVGETRLSEAQATSLATALLDACDSTPQPQAKLRQILFNLRTNPHLKRRVVSGAVPPDVLVALPREQLATDAVRNRDRAAQDAAQEAASVSAAAMAIQRVKKTGGTKMEWFGGDDEEIAPGVGMHNDNDNDESRDEDDAARAESSRDHKQQIAESDRVHITGTNADSVPAARGVHETSASPTTTKKRVADAEGTDGVYVSKRLRTDVSDELSATVHVQALAAARSKAVRNRMQRQDNASGSKSGTDVKGRAVAIARRVLDRMLETTHRAKVSRSVYKNVLRTTVHDLVAATTADKGMDGAWHDDMVTDMVAKHLDTFREMPIDSQAQQ
eukprot:m.229148 g.229148  ORF g.229148 m.229148 type:complete len:358 (-) comp38861_c0_seq1:181-1254(-)